MSSTGGDLPPAPASVDDIPVPTPDSSTPEPDRNLLRTAVLQKPGPDRSDEELALLDELLVRARILPELPAKTRQELCRAMTARGAEPGEPLFQQGSPLPLPAAAEGLAAAAADSEPRAVPIGGPARASLARGSTGQVALAAILSSPRNLVPNEPALFLLLSGSAAMSTRPAGPDPSGGEAPATASISVTSLFVGDSFGEAARFALSAHGAGSAAADGGAAGGATSPAGPAPAPLPAVPSPSPSPSVSVVALERCVLAVLSVADAAPILRAAAAVEEHTRAKAAFLRDVELFRDLPDALLLAIAAVTEVRDLPPNQVLIKQGCEAEELFLVGFGVCRAVREVRGLKLGALLADVGTRPATANMTTPPVPPNPYNKVPSDEAGGRGGAGAAPAGSARGSLLAPAGGTGRRPGSMLGATEPPGPPAGSAGASPPSGPQLSRSLSRTASIGSGGVGALEQQMSLMAGPERDGSAGGSAGGGPSLSPGALSRSNSLRGGPPPAALPRIPASFRGGQPASPSAMNGASGELGTSLTGVPTTYERRPGGAGAGPTRPGPPEGGVFFDLGTIERRGWFGDLTPSGRHRLQESTIFTATEVRLYVLNKIDALRRLDKKTIARVAAVAQMAATDHFVDEAAIVSEFAQAQQWERYKRALVLDILGRKRRERRGGGRA